MEEVEKRSNVTFINDSKELTNCLRNVRVEVRHIPKMNGIWGNDPRHVLNGGMSENAVHTYVVPRLSSGLYVNVLTDNEKAYLEKMMGLEANSMSIYKRENNFWADDNPQGINRVLLRKDKNFLNLAVPEDYIKYKILLANKDFICPSLKDLQDKPKASYRFVMVEEGETTRVARSKMNDKKVCYKEYWKVEDNKDLLKVVIETIEGRPVSSAEKLDSLQTKMDSLIESDSRLVLKILQDETLPTKVLINKAIEYGLLGKKNNQIYLRSDNSPLCEMGQESTLNNAAKFLNSPMHQELKFTLEARINEKEKEI